MKGSSILALPPNFFLKNDICLKEVRFTNINCHASSESHFSVFDYLAIPVWGKEMLHFHLTGLELDELMDLTLYAHRTWRKLNMGKGIYTSLYLCSTVEAVWISDLQKYIGHLSSLQNKPAMGWNANTLKPKIISWRTSIFYQSFHSKADACQTPLWPLPEEQL